MKTKAITKENFKKEVIRSKKTVLLDFWAGWCLPCRMLSPLIDEVAEEVDSKVVVGKINIDEEPELAELFGIMSIPTLLILSEGEITHRMIGGQSKDELIEKLLSTTSSPKTVSLA